MPKIKRDPTPRQLAVLTAIVKEYIATAEPVGSHTLIAKYFKDLSSATIRNDMVALQRFGLLEKTHSSSGRTPSVAGMRVYQSELRSVTVDAAIQRRLRAVLSERTASISDVISKAMSIISEVTNLPSVITEESGTDRLKRIDLVPLSKTTATFLIVTASGAVSSHMVTMDGEKRMDDIAVCVRVFNDRLVDTPLRDLADKAKALMPLIKNQVEDYEYIMQEIVLRIFAHNEESRTRLLDLKSLATQPEFKNIDRLERMLALLEDATVWKQIAHNQEKTGATTIAFGGELGLPEGVAVAVTPISTPGSRTSLALVGPTRMDLASVTALLDFLREEIQKN